MYKSYQYLGLSKNTYEFKIIDDDFEEIVFVHYRLLLCGAIIEVYSQKNLPVAPNLIRAMLILRDTNKISLDKLFVNYNEFNQYDPRWPEIKKDILKYLLFS